MVIHGSCPVAGASAVTLDLDRNRGRRVTLSRVTVSVTGLMVTRCHVRRCGVGLQYNLHPTYAVIFTVQTPLKSKLNGFRSECMMKCKRQASELTTIGRDFSKQEDV